MTEAKTTDLVKQYTRSVHESLDKRIIRSKPFENEKNDRNFLKMQYAFHWLVSPLFNTKKLIDKIPALESGCRLEVLNRDCLALGINKKGITEIVEDLDQLKVSDEEAIGWLYTVEGSNLGAAILLKMARKIGIDQHSGAEHLSGHNEGRGKHWLELKNDIDDIELTQANQDAICRGSKDAFFFVREQVDKMLPVCA